MYNETIYLAREVETGEVDEYGDAVMELETVQLFAEQKSIGQKEFYQAQTDGMKPEIKFVIPDYLDYHDEPFVIHAETRYKVLRTYRNERNELEVTCYGGVRDVSATISHEDQQGRD